MLGKPITTPQTLNVHPRSSERGEWKRQDIHILRPRMLMHGQGFPGSVYISRFPFSVFRAGLLMKKLPLLGIASAGHGLCVKHQVTMWINSLVQESGHTEVIPHPFAIHSVEEKQPIDSENQASRILLCSYCRITLNPVLKRNVAKLCLEEI